MLIEKEFVFNLVIVVACFGFFIHFFSFSARTPTSLELKTSGGSNMVGFVPYVWRPLVPLPSVDLLVRRQRVAEGLRYPWQNVVHLCRRYPLSPFSRAWAVFVFGMITVVVDMPGAVGHLMHGGASICCASIYAVGYMRLLEGKGGVDSEASTRLVFRFPHDGPA